MTSKDVTASGICADVGIGPTQVDEVIVVFKSYVTRVGTGPLDKELSLDEAEKKDGLNLELLLVVKDVQLTLTLI